MRRRLPAILTLVVACVGCAAPDVVPFCWSSDRHVHPGGRFATLAAPIGEVEASIGQWAGRWEARSGIRETLSERTTPSADAETLYHSANALIQDEWSKAEQGVEAAWPESDLVDYHRLCRAQTAKAPAQGPVLRLVFETPSRTEIATYLAPVTPFVVGPRSTGARFSSQIVLEQADDGGGRTTVYGQATPVNNGTVATPGVTIGTLWWKAARAEREASLVRDVFEFLEHRYASAPRE